MIISSFVNEVNKMDFSFFELEAIFSTILYVFLGLLLFVVSYRIIELLTPYSIQEELVEDQNQAIGTLMAGIAIGLSIIIAAATI